jgi:hypothetical protein
MDIILVMVCALGLFLITTWVQGRREAPVLEQRLHIVRERGPLILEADRALLDKASTPHAAGQPD